jgi:hypothetical protein
VVVGVMPALPSCPAAALLMRAAHRYGVGALAQDARMSPERIRAIGARGWSLDALTARELLTLCGLMEIDPRDVADAELQGRVAHRYGVGALAQDARMSPERIRAIGARGWSLDALTARELLTLYGLMEIDPRDVADAELQGRVVSIRGRG